MTRLLVVGGSGFIGRRIVERALSLGWDVTSHGFSTQRVESSGNLRHLTADLTDPKQVNAAEFAEEYDYVVNASGYIVHTLFRDGGREVLDAHFAGLMNLIQNINRSSLKRFVNIGSSDEYGNNQSPQRESSREAPISPYSIGKVAATHFLQMLHRTEDFPATVLRLFLTYGPGQDDRRFLPQIVKGCLDNRSFPTSEGGQLRDFCFIDDTVDAIFRTFSTDASSGEVINIGSGVPVTIRSVIETVREILGQGEPQFGAVSYRPGENMKLYADTAKSKEILGWSPRYDLRQGIALTIDHVRSSYER